MNQNKLSDFKNSSVIEEILAGTLFNFKYKKRLTLVSLVTVRTGFEPAISCVTGKHVNPYTTGPIAEVGLEPTTFGL